MAMTIPGAATGGWRIALLGLWLAGCAAAVSTAPTPVTAIGQIAGKWQGAITVGRGLQEFYYLTIEPDGSAVAQWGRNWQWGKVALAGGVASFELSGTSSGTIKYYEGADGRSMTLYPTFGGWSAQVRPVQ